MNERRRRSPRWKPRNAVRPPAAALAYLNGAMVLGLSLMTDYPGGVFRTISFKRHRTGDIIQAALELCDRGLIRTTMRNIA